MFVKTVIAILKIHCFSRMQDPALMIDSKEKNMHSRRFKNGKQIRKNEKFPGKKGDA